jgi:hypothetical protein
MVSFVDCVSKEIMAGEIYLYRPVVKHFDDIKSVNIVLIVAGFSGVA